MGSNMAARVEELEYELRVWKMGMEWLGSPHKVLVKICVFI